LTASLVLLLLFAAVPASACSDITLPKPSGSDFDKDKTAVSARTMDFEANPVPLCAVWSMIIHPHLLRAVFGISRELPGTGRGFLDSVSSLLPFHSASMETGRSLRTISLCAACR
jgi:hypothetical protein